MTSASKWANGGAVERLGLGVRGGAKERKEALTERLSHHGPVL